MRLALVLFIALLSASGASAANFVVNSPADGDDGTCDGENCTFREAIRAANALAGRDTILFLIRPLDGKLKTIRPLSQLPLLSDPDGAVVNGLTQTGSSANSRTDGSSDAQLMVELDGSLAGAPVHGLAVATGPTTIEGLVINRFSGSGIFLAGGAGHVILNNFIGTDATGMRGERNSDDGVTVLAADVRVGRQGDGQNLLSGNAREGIQVNGAGTRAAIEGNLIGVDADGLPRVGNSRAGISLWTSHNRVGALAPGTGNVIAGNSDAGIVLLTEDAHDNVVQGNSIFANRSHGVMITLDAWRNLIGRPGVFPQPSNSIVGNGGNGICITAGAGTPNTTLPFEVSNNELIPVDFTGGPEDAFGTTPNDPFDADDGPNGLQNSPVLETAFAGDDATFVEGLFPGDPEEDLLVSFYAGSTCHRSGRGDGRIVAGDLVIRTDEQGESRGRARVSAALGQFVSALAVDLDGNSSEMSNCVQVVIEPTPTVTVTLAPTATPDPFAPTATATIEPTATVPPTSTRTAPDTPTLTTTPTLPETPTVTETPTPEPTSTPTASPTPPRAAGDANCDARIGAADAVDVLRQIAAAELRCGADVDGDQVVSSGDLQLLVSLLFDVGE